MWPSADLRRMIRHDAAVQPGCSRERSVVFARLPAGGVVARRRFHADRIRRDLAGCPFAIHRPEGAIFLWLWFPGLPISSAELYERLKRRGVLIIPGHYFFPGLDEPWEHTSQCIRVTCSQDQTAVDQGLDIIAEEVKRAYAGE